MGPSIMLYNGIKLHSDSNLPKETKRKVIRAETKQSTKENDIHQETKRPRKKSIHYLWLRVSQETKISEQNLNVKSKYHISTAAISFFSLSKKEVITININLKQNDQKLKTEYSKQNRSNTFNKKQKKLFKFQYTSQEKKSCHVIMMSLSCLLMQTGTPFLSIWATRSCSRFAGQRQYLYLLPSFLS